MPSTRHRLTVVRMVLMLAAVLAASARRASAAPFVFTDSMIGINLGCGINCASDIFTSSRNGVNGSFIANNNLTAVVGGNTITFSQAAAASYGGLHAGVSATLTNVANVNRFVGASAQFSDLITIDGGVLNGTTGTLQVGYDLDGTVGGSGIASAFALIGLQWGTSGLSNEQFHPYFSSVNGTFQFDPITFTFGSPLYLSIGMMTVAGTAVLCPSCDPYGIMGVARQGTGSAIADLSNTLTLSGLVPRDAAGNVVTSVQFSSGSGTPYALDGVAVPEPASLTLLGSGLITIVWHARRRQRRVYRSVLSHDATTTAPSRVHR